MENIIQSLTDVNLAEAMDNNNIKFWISYGNHPGGYYKNEPGITWSIAGFNFSLYNSFLRSNLAEKDFEIELKDFMDIIKNNKLPANFWKAPTSQPVNIHKILIELGWKQSRQSPAMAMDISNLNNVNAMPDFKIEVVQDDEQRRLWADILNRSVGMNDQDIEEIKNFELTISNSTYNSQYRYLGYLNGEAVATGLIQPGDGLAGIYCIATLPKARNRGLGTHITLKLIEFSSDLGYKVVCLTSSEMGYRIYSNIGFKDIFHYSNYSWSP